MIEKYIESILKKPVLAITQEEWCFLKLKGIDLSKYVMNYYGGVK